MSTPLRVGIIGCGLMGHKRADALGGDRLVVCADADAAAASQLAEGYGATACAHIDDLLAEHPDVVVVAVPHNLLADFAVRAVEGGAHVLVEKPAGLGSEDVDRVGTAAEAASRLVKVGFNHRFHPGIERAIDTVRSGCFGELMFVRARYGHGGRLGYEREWRMDPQLSGGGELTDQGMHLLDLFHALLGPLPLNSSLLRTQYWDAPVEDNAVLVLGDPGGRDAPWGTFHASWTEWKNLFSLEIYCRTGKLTVDGLAGSYGPQTLRIYTMRPELGPPDLEEVAFSPRDVSWEREWSHFRATIDAGGGTLRGNLDSARYAWRCVEAAYTANGFPATEPSRA